MFTKIKSIIKSKFIKNVLVISSGTAGAQAISMLLSPIITRIYGPDAYGIMGTFSAIINIIVPIAALTYPIAIVLPKEDSDARGIIKLSLTISFIFAFTSIFLVFFLNEFISTLFNLAEVSAYLHFIPLVIVFAGSMQVMEQWLIRTKQFSINAQVTFIQSLIVNISKVGIGNFYPVAKVLVFFTAIANGLRALLMYVFSKNKPHAISDKTIDNSNMKQLMYKYRDFPMYRAPEVFLNAVSTGLPTILLSSFFSPMIAGFYSIVRTVLALPSQLIGKAVGDVFYPRVAEGYNNAENITGLIIRATFLLGIIGIVPFGTIILFGPQLFSFVFGNEWVTSGEYARWIALWSYVAFMNRPSVVALPVLKAQRFHLFYTIFMLITRIGLLSLGFFLFKSDIVSIALYGIAGAILNCGLIFITIMISSKRTRNN